MRVSSSLSAMIPSISSLRCLGHAVEVGGIRLGHLRRVAVGVVEAALRDQPDQRRGAVARGQVEAAARRRRTAPGRRRSRRSRRRAGGRVRAMTTARGMVTAAHSSQTATVAGSTPSAALTTNRAASAARSPARSSPTKSAYPGVSMRLILMPSCTSGATASPTERCCRTAAGSWSHTVVPSVTVPALGTAPVAASNASVERRLAGPGRADQHDVAGPWPGRPQRRLPGPGHRRCACSPSGPHLPGVRSRRRPRRLVCVRSHTRWHAATSPRPSGLPRSGGHWPVRDGHVPRRVAWCRPLTCDTTHHRPFGEAQRVRTPDHHRRSRRPAPPG